MYSEKDTTTLEWHSLFNGPESIVKLAKLMQQQDTLLGLITPKEYKRFHEISYSILSREVHSYAALDKYKMVDDDPTKLQLDPVRTTTQAVMEGSYRIAIKHHVSYGCFPSVQRKKLIFPDVTLIKSGYLDLQPAVSGCAEE